jgi:hypothetical protein
MILFSPSRDIEEKIKFLFDIFDYNEINTISSIDLEYLLICCCNATLRIYGLGYHIDEG